MQCNSVDTGLGNWLVEEFGRVIFSLDSDVRVQLADRPGVLLEHPTVPSGNTEKQTHQNVNITTKPC